MAIGSTKPQGMAAYRAPSLFQPHRARQALRDARAGKIDPLVGLYLGLSTVAAARYIAPLGFDVVWVDWEHTSCNVETMTTMVHELIFMSEARTMPFVRIPGHDHAAVGFALDCGASIIVPQVETVAEARDVVSYAKFGRKLGGTRSAPPFRMIPGVTDIRFDSSKTYHENMNEQAAIMIQIETLEGIHNLDAILTEVRDIDAVWLGTLDTRVSMDLDGNNGMGGPEPVWTEAVAKYNSIMAKHTHVARGGFSLAIDPSFKDRCHDKEFLVVSVDAIALSSMGREAEMAKSHFAAAKPVKEVTANGNVVTNGHVGNGISVAK